MDWGLFDVYEGDNKFLREEIVYGSTVMLTYYPVERLLNTQRVSGVPKYPLSSVTHSKPNFSACRCKKIVRSCKDYYLLYGILAKGGKKKLLTYEKHNVLS